jgi:hypothetical protein
MGRRVSQGIPFVLRGKKLPVLGKDFPFSEPLVKQARFQTKIGKTHQQRRRMRPYTRKEKAKIIAGAVSALVITGWLAVLALGFLTER